MNFKRTTELAIKYHDTLNPKIFDLGSDNAEPGMWAPVRNVLLKIAKAFGEFAGIPESAVVDVYFTGGNANYNYTSKSDMDVHLVIEPKLISANPEIVLDYMMDKKALWADNHPNIRVKGYPVEVFALPADAKLFHKDQGVYSLMQRAWIQAADNKHIDYDKDPHLRRKIDFIKRRIDTFIDHKSKDMAAMRTLKERIKNIRNAGIERGGEFALENLVYKELRDEGYLDKLSNYIRSIQDEELTLEAISQMHYTQEMEDWFNKRTARHISLVKKYAKILEPIVPGVVHQAELHDASKYEDLEKIPYIFISWDYHMKDLGEPFTVPKDIKERMTDATLHHVQNNRHHPEFFDKTGRINRDDRDKPPTKIVDGTAMTDVDIAEMVADWLAMAEEKGTSTLEWADKNINVRWKFTDDQVNLIYALIDVQEGDAV